MESLTHSIRCLRPGYGHIEHVELDWTPRTTTAEFPAEARNLLNWWQWMKQASVNAGKPLAYRDDTEDLLEEAGFTDISHRRVRIPLYWDGKSDRINKRETMLAHGYQMAFGDPKAQAFHGMSTFLLTQYLNWTSEQARDLCNNLNEVILDPVNAPPLYMNLWVGSNRHRS